MDLKPSAITVRKIPIKISHRVAKFQFLDITDENENSNEKIYFLSVTFRSNWMSAQSFCKSYDMDLVALESEHEEKYFKKICENNSESFEELSHIGGVSNFVDGQENWFWIASRKKVNFNLSFSEKASNEKEEKNCLQMVKGPRGFSYARTNCFGSELRKFVCQKMIFKSADWGDKFLRSLGG